MNEIIQLQHYLDPDAAVRGYVEGIVESLDIPKPSWAVSGEDFQIHALTEWPRNQKDAAKKMAVFIEPEFVSEDNKIGDGRYLPDTKDAYLSGYELVDYGDVEVPFTITGWAISKDVRDIMMHWIRRGIRLNQRTSAYSKYFDQPIELQLRGYQRNESGKDAEMRIFTFLIRGAGRTNDVLLVANDTTDVELDTTITG
jgi:hypothetical protein